MQPLYSPPWPFSGKLLQGLDESTGIFRRPSLDAAILE
jgi:hypothetical protein